MSIKTQRRHSDAAHVVAAKNLADIYVDMGGKRSEFFERHAKRHGYATWNAYRAAGSMKIVLPTWNTSLSCVPGLYYANSNVFLSVAVILTEAARKAGYTCDDTAPLVVSDTAENIVPLASPFGLVLRRELSHRSLFCLNDIEGCQVMDLLMDDLRGYEGLLIIDVRGLTASALQSISENCPKAVILAHAGPGRTSDFVLNPFDSKNVCYADVDMIDLPSLKRLEPGDMWSQRTQSMLSAFILSKEPLDFRNKPSVHKLNTSNAFMAKFAATIPGFCFSKRERDLPQDAKTVEQFTFLMMCL